MRYRKSTWFNTKTKKPEYGIEVKPEPRDHWFNLHEDGKPCIYQTEAERDAKLAVLKD